MKLKRITIVLTILLLLCNTICFAKGVTGTVITDQYKPGDLSGSDYDRAFELAGTIVSALTTVGVVVAVVGIMIMGIKYMIGSVEQKAEYKKTMIPYIIGCIFIFTISTIVSIIYNLVTQIQI